MPKQRVFLHLGFHRTGTTSIQMALSAIRGALLEQGFIYPLTGCAKHAPWGQHLLPWSLKENPKAVPSFLGHQEEFSEDRRSDIWSTLIKEINDSGARNVILSSEEFDTLSESELSRLSEILADFEVVPICFLRNYASFVESFYRMSLIYHSVVEDVVAFSLNLRTRLDIFNMMVDWSKVSGQSGDMRFLSYDDKTTKSDVLRVFLQEVGLADVRMPPNMGRELNQSNPAFICEIVRHMRASNAGEEHIQVFRQQMLDADFRSPPTHHYQFLTPEMQLDFDSRYWGEISLVKADAQLGRFLRGNFTKNLVPEDREGPCVTIGHLIDAMLALGRELNPARI